jgi:hypothetical protein
MWKIIQISTISISLNLMEKQYANVFSSQAPRPIIILILYYIVNYGYISDFHVFIVG